MTIHIRPTTALAQRGLLPEDPGVAMALAQALLERPLMFNHHHGLWGYTGVAGDGLALTVQSTGLGGPSTAIVLEELIDLGLRQAIRVGTCRSIDDALGVGELLVADAALAADGASRAHAGAARVEADAALTAALRSAAGPELRHGLIASTDLFYAAATGAACGREPNDEASWPARDVLAVDLETATLFALGAARGIRVGCVLVVADRCRPRAAQERIDDEGLAAAMVRAGRMGAAAVGLGGGALSAAAASRV